MFEDPGKLRWLAFEELALAQLSITVDDLSRHEAQAYQYALRAFELEREGALQP